ncbi:nucleotide sugar dehydrogenase [Thalassomonas viridans]|uniref:Nucleotide sugar dehydrogenase n=1 Tax=Thalassomonas viridans TaxID=137584 RepID=A0AAE9Z907_9GAMM|nr:nucleotide sugar dehydrogenase [Thalassomonas viridans]WDE08980.1 nucleotide sugar dehydrogenase [Thalassomonas viridans]
MFDLSKIKICVIGLGYVGLPLAVEFSKKFKTLGFDIQASRVDELSKGIDVTNEVTAGELEQASNIHFTSQVEDIGDCNFYVLTVPTPVDTDCIPDLSMVESASRLLGKYLTPHDVVVYESTVYPGATEEVAVPILEQESGLTLNKDLFVGYSPERINPGDKNNHLRDIVKIVSGSTPLCTEYINLVYSSIIRAGVHQAQSIKVAEAAKVIENTQRDTNIALINEFSIIFDKLSIDTKHVIDAAKTKWNFQAFYPGLVGGHCISVDPYYLAHKAGRVGHYAEMILSARRINEGMASHTANKLVRLMNHKKIHVVDSDILMLGFTFKENCPDVRNTQIYQLYDELLMHNAKVDIYDPLACPDTVSEHYGLEMIKCYKQKKYDAVVIAVAHDEFNELGETEIGAITKENKVVFDLKGILKQDLADARL